MSAYIAILNEFVNDFAHSFPKEISLIKENVYLQAELLTDMNIANASLTSAALVQCVSKDLPDMNVIGFTPSIVSDG